MSRRIAALALAAVLALAGAAATACRHPDPVGGCSRHPGECGRTT